MDIRMPCCDGVEATQQVLAVHPQVRVILLSGELDASVVTALKAGACGYLAKDAADHDLLDGIRSAAEGRPSSPRRCSGMCSMHCARRRSQPTLPS